MNASMYQSILTKRYKKRCCIRGVCYTSRNSLNDAGGLTGLSRKVVLFWASYSK